MASRLVIATVTIGSAYAVGTTVSHFTNAEALPKLEPVVAAATTDGGKYAARIDGAAQKFDATLPTPQVPVSIVNWGGGPSHSDVLIDDVAWRDVQGLPATDPAAKAVGSQVKRTAVRPQRHGDPALIRIAAAQPMRPVELAATPVPPVQPDHSLWGTTRRAMGRITSFGADMVGHLLP